MKILVLCTGNSCRSQMTEVMLRQMLPSIEVFSAGVQPEKQVSPMAISVLQARGYDTSGLYPKNVSVFLNTTFDVVLTVCDHAQQTCPHLPGRHLVVHHSFPDPIHATGSIHEQQLEYEKVRSQIEQWLSVEIVPLISSLRDSHIADAV